MSYHDFVIDADQSGDAYGHLSLVRITLTQTHAFEILPSRYDGGVDRMVSRTPLTGRSRDRQRTIPRAAGFVEIARTTFTCGRRLVV